MTFTELLKFIEIRLGYHQLPCNRAAGDIREIFDSSPVHTDLMTRIVRGIYKANRCQRPTDAVTRARTNEALAAIRLEILRASNTDVDVYHLIEDLCLAVDSIFAEHGDAPPSDGPRPRRRRKGGSKVVQLKDYRHRRFLRRRRAPT